MKIIFSLLFCFCGFGVSLAQKSFSDFAQFYPIGDDPNIRYLSSYTKQETILFEANTTVRYSVYNDFLKGLFEEFKHTQAWYLSFRPQIRAFKENSFPVKTPSYRVLLGTQHLFRLPHHKVANKKEGFAGFSLESGHYSNGQIGCAFSRKFDDASPACDSIYNTITSSTDLSEILNRRTGNFSTNLTELIFNYRRYVIDDKSEPRLMHSFNLGYTLYHSRFLGLGNFGGFSNNDIKIYGRHRFLFGYEYMLVFKKGKGARITVKENIEIIEGAHKSVNPYRSETTFSIYPFINSKKLIISAHAIGFFISYIYGHDNYNYRFVDSGHQASLGISWNQFPPFSMLKKK